MHSARTPGKCQDSTPHVRPIEAVDILSGLSAERSALELCCGDAKAAAGA